MTELARAQRPAAQAQLRVRQEARWYLLPGSPAARHRRQESRPSNPHPARPSWFVTPVRLTVSRAATERGMRAWIVSAEVQAGPSP